MMRTSYGQCSNQHRDKLIFAFTLTPLFTVLFSGEAYSNFTFGGASSYVEGSGESQFGITYPINTPGLVSTPYSQAQLNGGSAKSHAQNTKTLPDDPASKFDGLGGYASADAMPPNKNVTLRPSLRGKIRYTLSRSFRTSSPALFIWISIFSPRLKEDVGRRHRQLAYGSQFFTSGLADLLC